MKNKIKVGVLITAVALATALGSGVLYAQTAPDNGDTTFIQKLAQKLGISEDKVSSAVTEIRSEAQADREKAYEDKLTAAVTSGELTEAQKQLILNKHKEMKANRTTEMEAMKNMTNEQRKAAMESKRTELETWAKNNNIDMKWLMPMGMKGGHRGMMKDGFGMRGEFRPEASPTATAQ